MKKAVVKKTDDKEKAKSRADHKKQKARRLALYLALAGLIAAGLAIGFIPWARALIWGAAALLLFSDAILALKRSFSRALRWVTGVAIVAAIALTAVYWDHVIVEGRIVPQDALATELQVTDAWPRYIRKMFRLETLDMRNSTITDFSPLQKLTALKSLDVRGNEAFDWDAYNAVSEALPECSIHWLVPVDGEWVDSDVYPYTQIRELKVTDAWPDEIQWMTGVHTLDLADSTITDFSPILQMAQLESLDARGNTAFTQAERDAILETLPDCHIRWSIPMGELYVDSDAEAFDITAGTFNASQLQRLFDAYPDRAFVYEVSVAGQRVPMDAVSVDLSASAKINVDEVLSALELLPSANEVDLRGAPLSARAIKKLIESRPDVHFMCACAVPSGTMTTEDEQVVISKGTFKDLKVFMSFIDYMPNLVQMDARKIKLSAKQAVAVARNSRSKKMTYSFKAFGKTFTTLDTTADLDGVSLSNTKSLEALIKLLPNLKKVSMCDCGLSNKTMANLRKRYPAIKFVWVVTFAHYRVRTDATAFTTYLGSTNKYGFTESTFAPLIYCEDLMMLDLGHNNIRDISMLKHFKKLRVLILADNKIKDLSPIAQLKDLEYLELFLNNCKDLSPLSGLTKLRDLNIFYCPVSNITPLRSCTALERIWCGGCKLTSSKLKKLQIYLPKAHINTTGPGSTDAGWRKHSHYRTIQKMYKTGKYVPFSD